MREEIKKLLDSNSVEDNEVGWELVKAEKVSYEDVVEYVENAKVVTRTEQRYIWDGNKFIKNPNITSSLNINSLGSGVYNQRLSALGGYPTWVSTGGGTYTTGTITTTSGNYTFSYPSNWREEYKKQRDAEVQEEESVDIPGEIWRYIKNAFKRK